MLETIKIRVAKPSDVAALVKFNQLMAWETEQKELQQDTLTKGVSALISDANKGFYLVAEKVSEEVIAENEIIEKETAEKKSEVVGSLMITTEWSDWRNAVFWWIQSVYITPDFRRKGIYAQLYSQVKSLAAEKQGVCGFRLYVEKENIIAQKTYESLGMRASQYFMYEE